MGKSCRGLISHHTKTYSDVVSDGAFIFISLKILSFESCVKMWFYFIIYTLASKVWAWYFLVLLVLDTFTHQGCIYFVKYAVKTIKLLQFKQLY